MHILLDYDGNLSAYVHVSEYSKLPSPERIRDRDCILLHTQRFLWENGDFYLFRPKGPGN